MSNPCIKTEEVKVVKKTIQNGKLNPILSMETDALGRKDVVFLIGGGEMFAGVADLRNLANRLNEIADVLENNNV